MRYRHVDFRQGISVLANFAYGIAVLGTLPPPPPPPMSPSFCLKEIQLNKPTDLFAWWLSDRNQVQDYKLDWKNSLEHKLILFTNVGENCVLITYNGKISFNFIDIAAWVIATWFLFCKEPTSIT